MKKLKAVLRKLLGRTANHHSPVTIDICSNTKEGFVIIGWYYKDRVDSLSIVDINDNIQKAQIALITRDDVLKQTDNLGQGFELLCKTEENLNNLVLASLYKNQCVAKTRLTATQSGYASNLFSEDEFKGLSTESLSARAACDSQIVTNNYLMLNGWFDGVFDPEKIYIHLENVELNLDLVGYLPYVRKDIMQINNALSSDIVPESGFILLFKHSGNERLKQEEYKLFFERENQKISVPVLNIYSSSNPILAIRQVLKSWAPYQNEHLKHHSLFIPIVNELYPNERTTKVQKQNFGNSLNNPDVSIIVPLFGRFDFLKFQLSHFSRYPEYENTELIYVIDDPSIHDEVSKLANQVSYIHKHPFSILFLEDNMGFGGANNIGVEHASADTIVLLNSDVLPKDSSWLNKMYTVANQPDSGVVGARLLYEDNKIQHDGMAPMTLNDYPGYLFNDHPHKGVNASDVHYEKSVEPCILLTAACWMLKKSLFDQVGGFVPIYTLGDFEDSDLCLKLHALGKTNYIHHEAELYHLERQSQNLIESGGWKHNLTILNAIKFNQAWKDELVSLYPEVMHYE